MAYHALSCGMLFYPADLCAPHAVWCLDLCAPQEAIDQHPNEQLAELPSLSPHLQKELDNLVYTNKLSSIETHWLRVAMLIDAKLVDQITCYQTASSSAETVVIGRMAELLRSKRRQQRPSISPLGQRMNGSLSSRWSANSCHIDAALAALEAAYRAASQVRGSSWTAFRRPLLVHSARTDEDAPTPADVATPLLAWTSSGS